ncbi:MAG: TetR/AcrR family transcriptional regulator [Rhodobacteraceae bacterium]|nr:TetR/AcrR family transcriptional regulator [Paracoccaceae bacterium]
MSGHRKSAADRKREIVDTTLHLLASLPVETLTTERIAKEVGVSQAAIFRHFPTKNALWLAVLETVEARAEKEWDTALAPGLSPLDRLLRVLEAQLGLIAATPAVPKLIFGTGHLNAEPDIRQVPLRIMARLRAILLHEMETARSCGNLSVSMPATDLADLLLGLVQGTVLRWQLTGREFDLSAEGRRLVDCQIRLLATEGHERT